MDDEVALPGGQCTPGVVRVGDTVRRPLQQGWEFRHALLRQLEDRGFPMAPRLLGIDQQRREILSYLDGVTIANGEVPLFDIGTMIREFHAATAGTTLAGNREVVCHQDIAPWNTVHWNGRLVGLIDFDGAAPGDRLDDFAYAAWTFLDIGSSDATMVRTGLRDLHDGYGLVARDGLSDAVLRQQRRVLEWRRRLADSATDHATREMSRERVLLIQRQMEWVTRHRSLIDESI
ncbi:MAG TPA: phosphotransferase [Thermomicrobiales bacterium]|nr:phosphotransferase [Thermomicrobiales bacterium]